LASGYLGKILRVDLSREEITVETQPEIFYRRFLGGEGIVAYYLLKELPPKVDPLGPDNMLIFAAGPLTGVALSGVSRSSVGAKSPLTGGFGEAEAGGFWGSELKRAGYDGIVITGKAKKPVYLWITETVVEIKDGSHLWGKETGEAHEKIKKDHNDKNIRIALIGPGGENRVRYACILHDLHNAAGRTGMGAVMGSKNLKAIAVRGKQKVPVADKEAVKALSKKMTEVYLKDLEHFSLLGTGGDRMESMVWTGNLPIRNFRGGEFPTIEKIDPRTMKDTFGLKMTGCYACPIRCKKVVEFTEPYEVLAKYGGPEYESLGAFGSNCGVDDAKVVCKANELCNRYSIDVISTGVTISFAMECYEKGLISEELADGLEITFGNGDVLLKLVEKIAKREGLGDLLAEGVKRVAAHLGPEAEKYAMHVKGQEIPMHEPRLKRALGVGYAVSPTGADHMHNLNDQFLTNANAIERFHPLGIYETIPLEDLGAKKIRALIYQTNWRVVYNCLLMCMFQPWNHSDIVDITRAITGWNVTLWELIKTGERVTTMARAFNIREGFGREDDRLPERFFEPKTSGELSTTKLNAKDFEGALYIYYQMMGWTDQGIPTKVKLEELDIAWVAEYLPKGQT